MILTDKKILEAIESKQIVIEPFRRDCLGTNSYDVHLGSTLAIYVDEELDAKKHNHQLIHNQTRNNPASNHVS